MTTWRCPVCRDALRLADGGRAWRCAAGHAFDVAREGYVNLLITHQRRQREPGDSPEMVRARRTFLEAGWYTPLRDALVRIRDALPEGTATCDAGCGEGWYTRGWPRLWAVDIAKAAVAAAARRRQPGGQYAVASVYDLPLPDASVGLVLDVFAPLHAVELARVTAPGGLVVTATPGPDHLAGLAAELFETVEPHPGTGPFDDADPAATGLEHVGAERIRYEATIDGEGMVGALLGMTPWSWFVDADTRTRVGALPRLTTPVDFLVTTYRRTEAPPLPAAGAATPPTTPTA